jgi:hypothetical protein
MHNLAPAVGGKELPSRIGPSVEEGVPLAEVPQELIPDGRFIALQHPAHRGVHLVRRLPVAAVEVRIRVHKQPTIQMNHVRQPHQPLDMPVGQSRQVACNPAVQLPVA